VKRRETSECSKARDQKVQSRLHITAGLAAEAGVVEVIVVAAAAEAEAEGVDVVAVGAEDVAGSLSVRGIVSSKTHERWHPEGSIAMHLYRDRVRLRSADWEFWCTACVQYFDDDTKRDMAAM
jgi:hypothetical protein